MPEYSESRPDDLFSPEGRMWVERKLAAKRGRSRGLKPKLVDIDPSRVTSELRDFIVELEAAASQLLAGYKLRRELRREFYYDVRRHSGATGYQIHLETRDPEVVEAALKDPDRTLGVRAQTTPSSFSFMRTCSVAVFDEVNTLRS
jgi:hypothetical protein